jgi:hypothetical protein
MTEARNLDAKRVEIESKLAALKISPAAADLVRKADQAVAAHRAEAAELERALAEVDGQLGVREMDKRDAAAREKRERWQAARQQLLEAEEARLTAIEDTERATRALVDAINRTLAANARMSTLARELSPDKKAPMPLNPMDLVNRMASRIASVMMTVKGHKYRFGGITWPSAASGLYPANGPAWKEDEEQRMARALIGPLLEKGRA